MPINARARYPEDIELVFGFMARERIQRIRHEKGCFIDLHFRDFSDYERQ